VVTVNSSPIADVGADQAICNNEDITLVATGGGTYLWNTGATTDTIIVSPSTSTTYTVTVTSANGCTDTDDVIVNVSSTPTANAGSDETICDGESVTLTATGGTTYEWSTGATTASIIVSPSVTTAYTVTVTGQFGCSDTDDVLVNVNSSPTANAGTDQVICIGDTVTLSASGGTSYSWSTGENTQSIEVHPTATTTYTVTVSSANGCTDTDQVEVDVNAIPVADAGQDTTICENQSVILTATGGTSYSWSTGASTASINVNPSSTTTYIVTVTNGLSCSDVDSVIVTVNPAPVANAGSNQTICNGESATLTASGGVSYAWSTGDNTAGITVSPIITTTYTVTVTSANGCTDTDDVIITVIPGPTADAGADQSICIGESASLSAAGGVSYNWSTGETTQNITVSPGVTTSYTVTVTAANGCTDTDQVEITVNSLPTANAGVDQTICDNVSANLTATGGTVYAWSTGDNTASIVVSPLTTTTYTVTVTDANGCTDTDDVQVTVNPSPAANAGADQDICSGESASLTASGGGTYEWSTGETTAGISVSPVINTTYTVTVTSANGCTDVDDVLVTVLPLPTASAGADVTICSTESTTLTASGGVSYLWSTGGTNQSIIVNPSTTTTYTVTVTAANGCTDTDQVQVTVNSLPVANAGIDQTICDYESATLTATGGVSYLWSTAETTPSITVSPGSTTTYTVTVTDGNGCTDEDDVQVTVLTSPTANAGVDQTICNGESANLTASGGGTYEWSTGETSANISVSPLIRTIYTVTVTDANGCTDADDVEVTVLGTQTAEAGVDQTICNGENATLTASGGVSYAWSTGANTASIIVSPTDTTIYSVTVTSANGCTDTDAVTVNVNPLPVANAGIDQTICNGESATLTASGGVSYAWNTGDNTAGITVSPPVTTTYTVTVTGANGCTDTDDIIVTVLATPTANAGLDQNICEGDTVTLSASGGLDYAWSTGDNT
jgi:predicted transcriptional regulator